MICKSCNSECVEGARFCGICGAPILNDQPVQEQNEQVENNSDTNEIDASKNSEGDSELGTTILTADMNPTSAPLIGFTNKDDTENAPMMDEPVTNGTMMGEPVMNGTMMGEPAMGGSMNGNMMNNPMVNNQYAVPGQPGMLAQDVVPGQSGMLGNTTDTLARTDILSKTVAMDRQRNMNPNMPQIPQAPKAQKSGGSKVYLIVSIIVMVLLAGGLGGSILHFNGKVKDLEKQNEDITKEKEDMEATLNSEKSNLQSKITGLEGDVSDSSKTIAELQGTVTDYEAKIAELQNKSDAYAAFDTVINYAKGAPAYGYVDFFCSNNIVHMKAGEVAKVSTFFSYESGNVVYETSDASVADCEWDKDWQGSVLGLNIKAGNPGFTIIKITNDQNDEAVNVLVYVE